MMVVSLLKWILHASVNVVPLRVPPANRGFPASVGNILGCGDSKVSSLPPKEKPCQLPERLINSLYGDSTLHNK